MDCSKRAIAVLWEVVSNQARATVEPQEIAIGQLLVIAAQVGETRETEVPEETTLQIVAMETAWVIGARLEEVDLETRAPSAAVRDQAVAVRVPAVRAVHRA